MNVFVLLIIVLVVTGVTQTMVPVNARVGKLLGIYWATTLYLLAGTIAGLVLTLVTGEWGRLPNVWALPFYVYASAILNVAVLAAIIVLVPKLGIGAFWAGGVVGQIATSLLLDHFGLLGLPVDPISGGKTLAVCLLLVGTYFFVKISQGAGRNESGKESVDRSKRSAARWLLIGASALVGCAQSLMGTVNANVGQTIGISGAVTLYLAIGSLVAVAISIAYDPRGWRAIGGLPKYAFIPGVVNVLTVGLPATLIPIVGVSIFTSTSFTGYALTTMFLEKIGFLGMPKAQLTVHRVAGVVLMIVGVVILSAK